MLGVRLISIHALCEEGDGGAGEPLRLLDDFYPRPLRGGRRADGAHTGGTDAISIHALCEEGDSSGCAIRTPCWYFYPRPLRGGRHVHILGVGIDLVISIHALCEEGDLRCGCCFLRHGLFLSTPSARRATAKAGGRQRLFDISIHALCEEGDKDGNKKGFEWQISIHALCEEGDGRCSAAAGHPPDFYPRPLRGGRHAADGLLIRGGLFLSTPSARRATCLRRGICLPRPISIHALCEEGDSKNRDEISIFKQIIQHSARI